jgi:hypothetical protein
VTKKPRVYLPRLVGDKVMMPTHGYTESREAAMAAFAKSWRRE